MIKEKSIYSLTEENQVDYGNYVNQSRHMPHLLDGLKPAYRRMLWTALELPDRNTKVATLAGICGGKYSPHAPDSLPAVVSEMVHAGIFEGQGAHGSKSIYKDWNIGAAAGRYIEAKVDKKWREAISPLMSLVPKEMSELGYPEPVFIPTPIPMSLLFGSLGIGIGIRSTIPFFSVESIIKAMKADNPNLLEANGDLKINKRRSELKKLWTTGEGKVCYEFSIEDDVKAKGSNVRGIALYGDPSFIQVPLTSNLEGKGGDDPDTMGWIDRGLVRMVDESSRKTGKRIFFSVRPNQRGKDRVTMEMLRDELELMRFPTEHYKIAVTNGEYTEVLPLRDWVKGCYENYSKLVKEYKTKQLESLGMKRHVVINAKDIVDQIRKDDKIKVPGIAGALKISEDIVKETLRKSISVLMKINEEKELKDIAEEEKIVKLLKPEDFYEGIIA